MTAERAGRPEGHGAALRRLVDEDAVGGLRRREGRWRMLGTDNGRLNLDWTDEVERLLAEPALLDAVEADARTLRRWGIRHIVWAGMGGSVVTIRVLHGLGLTADVAIHPLDSTDPAAINAIVADIAAAKRLDLPAGGVAGAASLRPLLDDVMMIGVSLGMTSEEPVTHLQWFVALLEQAGLPLDGHVLVMTVPGSSLDRFAGEHTFPSLPITAGRGTCPPGRMSAPSTRVFLLPAALQLGGEPGRLQEVLRSAWARHDLALATDRPAAHAFVRLAAELSDASVDGMLRLLLRLPEAWQPLFPWIEQLLEQSLGKQGRGVVVFSETEQHLEASPGRGTLRLQVTSAPPARGAADVAQLPQPDVAHGTAVERLAAVAAAFLGWQLTTALYGYLHDITVVSEPAVENYKARARALRTQADPLGGLVPPATPGPFTLLGPPDGHRGPTTATTVSEALRDRLLRSPPDRRLGYLDVTINGDLSAASAAAIAQRARTLGNGILGVPTKFRLAPAAYHISEQSEMDGPEALVSLRVVARRHQACTLGSYGDGFLLAQAVATWQAMSERNRCCFLLVVPDALADGVEPLLEFFDEVAARLRESAPRAEGS